MVKFLLSIGPFLVPLVILSLYSIALILEKARFLALRAPLSERAFSRFLIQIYQQNDEEAKEHFKKQHPYLRYLDLLRKHPKALGLLEGTVQTEVSRLEDRLSYFPALANLATLLGLFGTVCGMILSFGALQTNSGAEPAELSGGIAQALTATALGLFIAIPNLAAHAFFQRKIQTCILQWEGLLALTNSDGKKNSYGHSS